MLYYYEYEYLVFYELAFLFEGITSRKVVYTTFPFHYLLIINKLQK